jgi:hypothetical protein
VSDMDPSLLSRNVKAPSITHTVRLTDPHRRGAVGWQVPVSVFALKASSPNIFVVFRGPSRQMAENVLESSGSQPL